MRRLTAALLLATYGSVGVLGYGLHALWHVHHHHGTHSHSAHSHSASAAAAAGSSCGCSHHQCDSDRAEALEAALAKLAVSQLEGQHSDSQHTNSRQSDAHQSDAQPSDSDGGEVIAAVIAEGPCSICAVLAQSQSAEVAICSGWLVGDVPAERPAEEILQPLYLISEHLARGPPAC